MGQQLLTPDSKGEDVKAEQACQDRPPVLCLLNEVCCLQICNINEASSEAQGIQHTLLAFAFPESEGTCEEPAIHCCANWTLACTERVPVCGRSTTHSAGGFLLCVPMPRAHKVQLYQHRPECAPGRLRHSAVSIRHTRFWCLTLTPKAKGHRMSVAHTVVLQIGGLVAPASCQSPACDAHCLGSARFDTFNPSPSASGCAAGYRGWLNRH